MADYEEPVQEEETYGLLEDEEKAGREFEMEALEGGPRYWGHD